MLSADQPVIIIDHMSMYVYLILYLTCQCWFFNREKLLNSEWHGTFFFPTDVELKNVKHESILSFLLCKRIKKVVRRVKMPQQIVLEK